MTTVLVSGGLGFIGRHLVSQLLHKDNYVIILDNKKVDIKDVEFTKSLIDNGLYKFAHITADVRDVNLLEFDLVDTIVHLAAFTDVQESIDEPIVYFDDNLRGTLNMLYNARENKVKRFIFASSAAADNPQSPYGVSKLCGEHWCNIFHKCYGLSTVSLRFFNVYGKGTDKGVIPTWIKAIKNGERPVIYGGNQVRDFIYVEDVVRAIIYAMECDAVGVCEVGTGRGIAIFDLAQELLEVMKSDLKIIPKERKEGEIEESIAKHKAHTRAWIGWKPKYILEQGLREMLK